MCRFPWLYMQVREEQKKEEKYERIKCQPLLFIRHGTLNGISIQCSTVNRINALHARSYVLLLLFFGAELMKKTKSQGLRA